MYVCNYCGKMFEEPSLIHDDPSPSGVGLPSGHYTYQACPYCGDEDIEGTSHCVSCEIDFSGNGECLCDDCKKELADALDEIRKDMKLTQDDFEQAIAEYFGW